MSAAYVILKILMWVLIVLFAGDLIMQTISYSFYKGDRNLEQVTFRPEKIQVADDLIGYGYSLEQESNHVILCFGGSMYVAYNTVGMYGGYYDCPFLSVDYYGTQESSGRMSLQTMQKSAEALYDYAIQRYPGKAVIVMGHSYGCGMAAYLTSARDCSRLILLSGYRTSADIYNRILPFYWGAASGLYQKQYPGGSVRHEDDLPCDRNWLRRGYNAPRGAAKETGEMLCRCGTYDLFRYPA